MLARLRRTGWLRLLATAIGLLALGIAAPSSATPAVNPGPVPRAHCGAGSLPETGSQGRVSAADVASGRATKGYRCNARLVSHIASPAGYKVQRYVDPHGHECAYYDS